ncbi:hypothetical protein ACQKMK_02515 [Viridibacillus arvi]|uniref:hypothetical protein n=1 Tax=Viridibacillus arvi TaxID=263475 RepID=UPI003CFBD7EC
MEQLIIDTKNSYYEYVSRIPDSCQGIANLLREGNTDEALSVIINLVEGLTWLLSVEELMFANHLVINSRIAEANEFLTDINNALESGDFVTVADLFEYEIQPLFSSAIEWVFRSIKD